LSDQYAQFLEEWKKEDELEEITKVIRMINKKINYVEKEKTNELRKYLYNTDSFDYDIFRKFYLDKYKTYNLVNCKYFDKDDEFEFINVEDKKFKTLLIQTYKSMTELRKICNILNNYHKKTYTIISKLIQIDYSDISDYNTLKKIMTCLFFKRANNRLVYSVYKKIKDIFHKKEAKLKKINEEHNLFDIELNYLIYKYCTDDKASSGECVIFGILFELFKNNKSLIYFCGEYVLPVKFKNNLRADFFCLIIDKEHKIRKLIIEVHGGQHYKLVPFFNDIHSKERDAIKKEYCEKNNILFIELSYDKITSFKKTLVEILL
jgi:hypothetical protein